MHALARFLFAALAAGVALSAIAQQQTLSPSDTLACLTPVATERGTPKYPEESFERKEGGLVSVVLEFTAPDREPKVSFSDGSSHSQGDLKLKGAVLDHVRAYRVPCLKLQQTATMNQEFSFVPTDGRRVRWQGPVDADDLRRSRLMKCMKHQSPGSTPDYPFGALRNEIQGNVMLKLSFASADAPPAVEVVDDAGSGSLASTAAEFARGWRMPCHEGASVSLNQLYKFRIEGADRTVLKDMSLVTLLGIVKGIRKANVYFDFKEMGCPFDLRFSLNQPHAANNVGEVGDTHPERRFFLDWLSRQHLELPGKTHNAVLGQIATVSVPCTVLNLGTKSGGSASQ